MRAQPGGRSAVSDVNGAYRLSLPSGWRGTIKPSRQCRTFDPAERRVDNSDDRHRIDFVVHVDRRMDGCNRSPLANPGRPILVEPPAGSKSARVRFDAGDSEDPDGTIISYAWDYENRPISSEAAGTIELPIGLHRLRLRVTDDIGAVDEALLSVTVRGVTEKNRIYVSPQPDRGSDMNPGTEAQPLRSIGRAARFARPGDTIVLLGGTYVESFIHFANSGEPDAPITVEGREGEEVLLTSGSSARWIFDFTPRSAGARPDAGHYVFRNFKATGSGHVWRFAFPGTPGAGQPHHITIEDVEAWKCASVLAARHGGVSHVTIRRCDFYQCNGTEGTLDFSNNVDDLETPRAGSHDILIEDCLFHDNNSNNQINGMVTQGSVYNVTIRRSRCWNNGRYGFALKGSGNFVIDKCASWGNSSAQFYLRGMVADDPRGRKANGKNSHTLTNCIAIGARNSGSGAVIWRENTDIRLLNCTIIALRDETRTKSGGPFGNGERHLPPYMANRAEFRNTIICTLDGGVMWFLQAHGSPHMQNRTYYGDHNIFFSFGNMGSTLFRYQDNRWQDIDGWKEYWAEGAPNGDDALNGPRATNADANSLLTDPKFALITLERERIPMARDWPANFAEIVRPAPSSESPLSGNGQNLTEMNIPELMTDFDGNERPKEGPWTIGAIQKTGD
ncbi:MAG TPA: right-handed parallel beta-helix repeat-containing protein [Phycisphaerae bacterium]|nr:right-handed parallel beta-helix repeat-containing protein [Phycisphaerae bacterium]